MRCWFVTALLLAACATTTHQPSRRISLQGERAFYTFDTANDDWDVFTVPGSLALFRLDGGVLQGAVVGDRGYIWSLNHTYYRNVAVEADVRQTRGGAGNGFGVMCRADRDGNGYYFVISSAGQFAILRAMPGLDDPTPLVKWQPHPAIRTGLETNTLSMMCVNDYLAFFANGQFLAETRDGQFEGGQLGVVLGATGQTAWVEYDAVRVRDAALVGSD